MSGWGIGEWGLVAAIGAALAGWVVAMVAWLALRHERQQGAERDLQERVDLVVDAKLGRAFQEIRQVHEDTQAAVRLLDNAHRRVEDVLERSQDVEVGMTLLRDALEEQANEAKKSLSEIERLQGQAAQDAERVADSYRSALLERLRLLERTQAELSERQAVLEHDREETIQLYDSEGLDTVDLMLHSNAEELNRIMHQIQALKADLDRASGSK